MASLDPPQGREHHPAFLSFAIFCPDSQRFLHQRVSDTTFSTNPPQIAICRDVVKFHTEYLALTRKVETDDDLLLV